MTKPHILFRCDASLLIGTGHVMRCRTLARELERRGAVVTFLCRRQAGDLIRLLEQEFSVLTLPEQTNADTEGLHGRDLYTAWLGCSQAQDAADCLEVLGQAELSCINWVVVDHYGLAAAWERQLLAGLSFTYQPKLLVIDDLADRYHQCNLLLDQNMVDHMNDRYRNKVPDGCICLLGPKYALIAPSFNHLRSVSLSRRTSPKLRRLLVFLGGSDADNATSKVIKGTLLSHQLWEHIDIVVGKNFIPLQALKNEISGKNTIKLHIQTTAMPELMSYADFAITSGGGVTWEKCILGLPSLVVIQEHNQYPIASKMHELGAQHTLGWAHELTPLDYAQYLDQIRANDLVLMSEAAQVICDGLGAHLTASALETLS